MIVKVMIVYRNQKISKQVKVKNKEVIVKQN
jgi:hypothetical protein